MSSGLVRSAIAAVLEDKDFSIESLRILNAKSLAGELISKAVESEEKMEKFDSFASELRT
jgi:aspartate-semialdehyde dehydrogenase